MWVGGVRERLARAIKYIYYILIIQCLYEMRSIKLLSTKIHECLFRLIITNNYAEGIHRQFVNIRCAYLIQCASYMKILFNI